jgi:hypothetical protein
MADELNDKSRRALKDMFETVDTVDVDGIATEGITIRSGNKLLKLEVVAEEEISIEAEIREELKLKLRDKLQEIKSRLNTKVTEMVEMTSRIKMEAERKEKQLKDKLRRTSPMPEVFLEHAQRGISVVKGGNRDELIWLIQGVYAPKFVDFKKIQAQYAKRLISPVVFKIVTKGDRMTGCSTRQPIGLDYFDHYHQSKPDCWGNWKGYKGSWNDVNDLIRTARDAEAVLENINTNSVAQREPRGLPRQTTLERHVLKTSEKDRKAAMSQENIRLGIEDDHQSDSEDVWTV